MDNVLIVYVNHSPDNNFGLELKQKKVEIPMWIFLREWDEEIPATI